MTTCSRCPSPARWRDADGRQFCAGHVPANGKPLARLPAPPEPDIADRLEAIATAPGAIADGKTAREAAAEIRRLRALLEAAGDNSGAC
jgi:acyl-CoA reductase-like NAD-dependent aldehyde dehydrogenase